MDLQGDSAKGRGRFFPLKESYRKDEVQAPLLMQPVLPVFEGINTTRLSWLTGEVTRLGAVAFHGGTDYMLAECWIENMQTYFKMIICTDVERWIVATFLLQDEAKQWWDFVLKTKDVATLTWRCFVGLFRDKYFPASAREQLGIDFISLVQGTMSVRDYEARFSQLYRFVWPMDAEKLARRFEQGLNYEIRERVIILRLPTVAMILDRAMAIERELQASRRESSIVGDFRGKGKAIAEGSNAPGTQDGSRKRQKTCQQAPVGVAAEPTWIAPVGQAVPLRCFNCNQLGHMARNCVKPKCRKCYKCGLKGHVVRECTQPKVMRERTHQQAPAMAAAAPVGQVLLVDFSLTYECGML
ncbi:uncharacterized protein LOC112203612 [Rosa chinensis]|uniref:uncharacterized protein LOC112203612 n=1 Tax=Rosa chinensis TaxID=74649 RepID=UPI000D08CFC0|nr:uncharacterized protein LOC112203612 [Rosa chinensis]